MIIRKRLGDTELDQIRENNKLMFKFTLWVGGALLAMSVGVPLVLSVLDGRRR